MDLAPITARRAAELAGLDLETLPSRLSTLGEVLSGKISALARDLTERIGRLPEMSGRFRETPKEAAMREALGTWLHRLLEGPHDESLWIESARLARLHARFGLHQDQILAGLRFLEKGLVRALPPGEGDRREALEELFLVVQAVMLQAHSREREERFRRSERLAALGKIVAEVNHDLQNPLAVIRTSLYSLRSHLEKGRKEGVRVHLDRIQRNAELAIHIASDLLDLTRHRKPETQHLDLSSFLGTLLEEFDIPPGIRLEAHLDPGAGLVEADPTMLQRVFQNLLRNAVQAMGGRGTLTVSTRRSEDALEIAVADTGPGFPEEEIQRVFEPLFSTRPDGAGLGLAIARKLVEAHAGRIRAVNPPGGGAMVLVTLPAGRDSSRPPSRKAR